MRAQLIARVIAAANSLISALEGTTDQFEFEVTRLADAVTALECALVDAQAARRCR